MVSGRGRTWQPGLSLGEEVVAGVANRRPGRDDAGGEVERYDEADKACAAETSSSTSGTSESS